MVANSKMAVKWSVVEVHVNSTRYVCNVMSRHFKCNAIMDDNSLSTVPSNYIFIYIIGNSLRLDRLNSVETQSFDSAFSLGLSLSSPQCESIA